MNLISFLTQFKYKVYVVRILDTDTGCATTDQVYKRKKLALLRIAFLTSEGYEADYEEAYCYE